MASRLACDGCHALLPADASPVEYGLIRKTIYCEPCEVDARIYLADRDLLHTDLAERWSDGLASLQKAWRDAHPTGRLPDE
jgi:hypothetical protein